MPGQLFNPICLPKKHFNPLNAYPRNEQKDIENNYTRALFVGLRAIAEYGMLSDWMKTLEKIRSDRAPINPKALQRFRGISDALAMRPNDIVLRLLGAPSKPEASTVLLMVISNREKWNCGMRLGKGESIPDGTIIADGHILLVESKTLDGTVDAIQVAKHLRKFGLLLREEEQRLSEQDAQVNESAADNSASTDTRQNQWLQWAAGWKADLEGNGRVLTVGWNDIGKCFKDWLARRAFAGSAPSASVEVASKGVVESVLEYFRDKGLLAYEGIPQTAKFAEEIVAEFNLWREQQEPETALSLDRTFRALKTHRDSRAISLIQSLESLRDQFEGLSRDLRERLGDSWKRSDGRALEMTQGSVQKKAVRKGYDVTDIYVRWTSERLDNKGGIVLGFDVTCEGLLICWHEQCKSAQFPALECPQLQLEQASRSARGYFERWCKKWAERLIRLPEGPWTFRYTFCPLGFLGKSRKWHGACAPYYDDSKTSKDIHEVRGLFGNRHDNFWRTQFCFPCPDASISCDLDALRRSVRKPSFSLYVGPNEGKWGDKDDAAFLQAVDAMARWADGWTV